MQPVSYLYNRRKSFASTLGTVVQELGVYLMVRFKDGECIVRKKESFHYLRTNL